MGFGDGGQPVAKVGIEGQSQDDDDDHYNKLGSPAARLRFSTCHYQHLSAVLARFKSLSGIFP
jgi:hypothetical protein